MPQERDMVRIAEQEEQELRTQLEQLGLDPELENYPNYRGTRRYGNADMKRFGVNGDIVLDPTQLELYEMTQRTRALAGLLPEENRRIFLSLLDLNERALACCARGDQLGLGWGILDEMGFADRDPQLKSLVQQKQLELPEKFLSYRSFYVLMAAMCDNTLRGRSAVAFGANLRSRLDTKEAWDAVNELLEPMDMTAYDVAGLFAQAADQWRRYQEIQAGDLSSLEPISVPGQAPIQPERPEFLQVQMEVQEYMPGLIDPFLIQEVEKTRLTTAQRQFAVQNFDRTFDAVFPRGMRESLAQEGKDIFDQIFIDGKSMNDLWEEEYQRTSYSYSAEQMKLHFMEAALSSKRIQVLVPGSDGDNVLAFEAFSRQERIREAVQAAAAARPKPDMSDAAAIHESQQALEERSEYEKEEKRQRIIRQEIREPDMKTVPLDDRFQDELRVYVGHNAARENQIFGDIMKLGELSGRVDSAPLSPEDRESMLRSAETVYEDTANMSNIWVSPESHPLYGRMGIYDRTQLFFIDGQPAYEYIKDRTGRDLDPQSAQDQRLIKAEIMAAIASCEHRVEMAKIGMDEYGAYQIGVVSVQPGLKALDGRESWYQRKPSSKAERFYKKDDGREQRLSDIRLLMGNRLLEVEKRRLRIEEDPYHRAKMKFSLTKGPQSGYGGTLRYFGEENMERLKAIGEKLPSDYKRGQNHEMGGCRLLAEFLVMAENPQIRYSDLTNGERYVQEKRAAAERVTAALEKMFAPKAGEEADPKPLADIIASCIRMTAGMDVRKELLYALGAQETAGVDEVKEVMKNRSPEVSEFLNSMAMATQAFTQLTGFRVNAEATNVLYPGEDGLAIEQEISARLTSEEKLKYRAASSFLIYGLASEQRLVQEADNYRWNPNVTEELRDITAVRDVIREMIADDIKPNQIPMELSASVSRVSEHDTKLRAAYEKIVPHSPDQERKETFSYMYNQGSTADRALVEGHKLLSIGMEQEYTDNLNGDENCFENPESIAEIFNGLEEITTLSTIKREATRSDMVRLFALAEGQASMDEMLSTDRKEVWRKAGRDFTKALMEHPVHEAPDDVRRESVQFYAGMYARMADKLSQEQIPDIDWSDPIKGLCQLNRMCAISHMVIDWSQTVQNMRNKYTKDFMEGYRIGPEDSSPGTAKGEELFKQHDDNLNVLAYFSSFATEYMQERQPLVQRVAAKMTLERTGELLRGVKVSELSSRISDKEITAMNAAIIALVAQQDPDEKAMRDYLGGKIKTWPIDESILDQVLGQEKQNTEREKSRKKTNIAEVEAKEKTENRGAKKSREQAAVKKPEREKQKEAPEPKGPRR